MDKKYNYFISYNHLSYENNGSAMCSVSLDDKIKNMDDVMFVRRKILESNASLKEVVIINYQLFEE